MEPFEVKVENERLILNRGLFSTKYTLSTAIEKEGRYVPDNVIFKGDLVATAAYLADFVDNSKKIMSISYGTRAIRLMEFVLLEKIVLLGNKKSYIEEVLNIEQEKVSHLTGENIRLAKALSNIKNGKDSKN